MEYHVATGFFWRCIYICNCLSLFFFSPFPSLKVEELLKGLKALYCLLEKEEVASVDLETVQE